MRETLDPATSLGAVRLTVADLERVQDFYEQALGLRPLARAGDVVELGPDAEPLVALVGDEEAPPRPGRSTGLFHLALLVPTRADLAQAMRRVLQAGRSFTGAADHLVSEALYLEDPEGNGVEIYRDRPREEWRYQNDRLAMATESLDLEGLMAELPHEGEDLGMPAGTKIGHVHLQVADLAAAEAFYSTLLGFEVSVRGYPGALFVSAGGYHHHIGLNTWAGEGAPAPPPGSRGLRWFEVVLPSAAELGRVSDRLAGAGLQARSQETGLLVPDPSGNLVLLASGPQPRVDSTR